MASWTLTLGLQNLRAQVNARWPNRDHASDGTIGDDVHRASISSHNPDDTAGSRPAWTGDPDSAPEVRAWDMDSDLREPGTSAQMVVDHIRRLPGLANVLRYMIYNRRMYHVWHDFEPVPYDGPSAHTEHIHFEGAWSQAADNNTTFDYRLEEVGEMVAWTDKPWNSDYTVAQAIQGSYGTTAALVAAVAQLNATAAGILANVKADDNEKAQILADAQAKHNELLAAVATVDDQVIERLSGQSVTDIAEVLRAALGAKAKAVGQLLAGA